MKILDSKLRNFNKKLDSLLSKLNFSNWNRSNLNITSIQSSGNLNNVENSELKNLIYDFYRM